MKLAIVGGEKVLKKADESLFHWPIVNEAMRAAQTKVLEEGNYCQRRKAQLLHLG